MKPLTNTVPNLLNLNLHFQEQHIHHLPNRKEKHVNVKQDYFCG